MSNLKILDTQFNDPQLLGDIIDMIKDRRFLVISVGKDGSFKDHWYGISDMEAIFGIEALKVKIMTDDRLDEVY